MIEGVTVARTPSRKWELNSNWWTAGNEIWFDTQQPFVWRSVAWRHWKRLCSILWTPLVWHFIKYNTYPAAFFFPVVLVPRQRSNLWSFSTVHSSGFWGISSPSSFTFSCFFLFSIPPSVLLFWAVLTPLKHSSLWLFSEVSYTVPLFRPLFSAWQNIHTFPYSKIKKPLMRSLIK